MYTHTYNIYITISMYMCAHLSLSLYIYIYIYTQRYACVIETPIDSPKNATCPRARARAPPAALRIRTELPETPTMIEKKQALLFK